MKPIFAVLGASIALAACSQQAAQKSGAAASAPAPAAAAPAPSPTAPIDVPAGAYKLDPAHSNLLFRLDHLGFSKYIARFAHFDASLHFDPKAPQTSTIEATVDPASLSVATPPEGFLDDLRGPQWLDTKAFPAITFKSTKVEVTGPRTARVTGDLTLHGVTKPLVLEATFNGGYAGHPMDPHARIGISATGTFNRSDFGMGFGVPAPGTTMGVGDAVAITIETEFTGPPLAAAG